MEAQATLIDASRSLDGSLRMTFRVKAPAESIDLLTGKTLRLSAVQWREKRSLDANAYFHKLVNLISRQKGVSDTEEKNLLIREYGAYEYDEDGNIPTITVRAEYAEKMINMEGLHLKPISSDTETVRMALMRGSHTYDSKEMARLIDGAIYEAKECGIPESEILTPNELARMEALWEPRR